MKRAISAMWTIGMLFSGLNGCSTGTPKFNNLDEYHKWVSDTENGLIKSREIDGYGLKIKYLHPEFLAFKECKTHEKTEYDSLLNLYSSTLTFLLNIGPSETSQGDIMREGVKNYEEYKSRFHSLNFDMETMVELKSDSLNSELLTYSVENTFGLTDYRNIYMVFSDVGKDAKDGVMTFSFDGQLFEIGMCHFQFDVSDIKNPIEFKTNNGNEINHENFQ